MICTKCPRTDLTEDDFYFDKRRGRRVSECKYCQRERSRTRYKDGGRRRSREAHRRYYARHQEQEREYQRRQYHARHRGMDTQTADYMETVLRMDPCAFCGARPVHIDHIVPVRHLGGTDWANLTAACRSCNVIKSDRTLLQFLLILN